MTKSIIAAALLVAFAAGMRAAPISAPADKAAPAAMPAAVAAMMGAVSEIGKILEERHVVYAAENLAGDVLAAMVQAIDPEGGAILTREQAARRQDEEQGLFYGIGCTLRVKDKWPRILAVSSNSPAAQAGLGATNLIVKIDGRSTENMPLDEVVRLLRGGKDEALELTVCAGNPSEAKQTRAVKLKRSAIHVPVTGTIETWPQGIGYLKVNGLYPDSGHVIVEQLDAWQGTNCFGAILDLRGANGMDLASAADIGGLFARAGATLFILRDGHNKAVAAFQSKPGRPVDKPVMVLIDEDTSGAAEVLAGLLSVCKGAMLIGQPTRGDNRLRDIIPLADGRVLYIATRRVELNDGPDYYQTGVNPHVRVAATNAPAAGESEFAGEEPDIFSGVSEQERQDWALIRRVGADAILRRAVDILLGLKALDRKVR